MLWWQVWGGALRAVWVYHITWFVNSASHVWGSQSFNTGDQSRNNWCAAAASGCNLVLSSDEGALFGGGSVRAV